MKWISRKLFMFFWEKEIAEVHSVFANTPNTATKLDTLGKRLSALGKGEGIYFTCNKLKLWR